MKFDTSILGKCFFWFGLVCGVLGIFTQYGVAYQVGTQRVFADATFYFLLGSLAMLAGIFLNTDQTNRLL
ncbi:MAG: hypothetical protein HY092_01155 [Candidatus Kerfeldbacteria bacterium]|nr:hypothetical protein [Candidatus Kerfeldbacteria bacterium]